MRLAPNLFVWFIFSLFASVTLWRKMRFVLRPHFMTRNHVHVLKFAFRHSSEGRTESGSIFRNTEGFFFKYKSPCAYCIVVAANYSSVRLHCIVRIDLHFGLSCPTTCGLKPAIRVPMETGGISNLSISSSLIGSRRIAALPFCC